MFRVSVIARAPEYVPSKKNPTDAGYDLKACVDESYPSAAVTEAVYKALVQHRSRTDEWNIYDFKFYLDGVLTRTRVSGSCDSRQTNQDAQHIADQYVWPLGLKSPKVALLPGQTKLISTGIKLKMPLAPEGWNNVIQIYPRSGLGIKSNLILANSVGIVDQGYISQELGLGLINNSDYLHIISDQSRVAQALFTRALQVDSFDLVDEFDLESDRGGGFGSTGVAT